jgi:hypothetical protein
MSNATPKALTLKGLNKEHLLNPFRVSFGFTCQPGVLRRAKLLVACGEKTKSQKQSAPVALPS